MANSLFSLGRRRIESPFILPLMDCQALLSVAIYSAEFPCNVKHPLEKSITFHFNCRGRPVLAQLDRLSIAPKINKLLTLAVQPEECNVNNPLCDLE